MGLETHAPRCEPTAGTYVGGLILSTTYSSDPVNWRDEAHIWDDGAQTNHKIAELLGAGGLHVRFSREALFQARRRRLSREKTQLWKDRRAARTRTARTSSRAAAARA